MNIPVDAHGNLVSLHDRVNASPKDGDFAFEFEGTVTGFKQHAQGVYIQVEDMDGDCFDCEPEQVNAGSTP